MRTVIYMLSVILLTFFTLGCSGGDTLLAPPPAPPTPPPQEDGDLEIPEKQGFTHLLFGKAQLEFNEDAGGISLVPLHSSQTHYNLTDPLSDPLCPDCIIVEQLWHDEDAKSIGLKISLRNPSDFTFYDVRGIMHGGSGLRILDNDGFTDLFTPESGVYNPFLAYCLEKPDIDFSRDQTSERVYSLTYENLSDLDIEFIVEGSYPGHCEEPAILRVAVINDDELFIYGGYANLNVEAIDRQDDINGITAVSDELWDGARDFKGTDEDIFRVAFSNEKKTAAGVRQIEITADSENPDGLVIKQFIDVDVHFTHPMEESYLGGGHPIEGVNYRRNNQSPYLLPKSLDYEDSITPFKHEYDWGWGYSEKFHHMVIDGNERMYIGRTISEWWSMQNGSDGYSDYDLISCQFDENNYEGLAGGMEIALTRTGVFTTSFRHEEDDSYDMGNSDYIDKYYSSLYYYNPWLEVVCEVTGYWGVWNWFRNYTLPPWGRKYMGDWNSRVFEKLFPLPDGNLLALHSKPGSNIDYLQLVTEDFQVLAERVYTIDEENGFAFDEETGSLYGLMYSELLHLDSDLSTTWGGGEPPYKYFGNRFPVIDDKGCLVGCSSGRPFGGNDSYLKRIGSNGEPKGRIDCGASQRPVILNDGTIAVGCGEEIKYFDTNLNHIGTTGLPSGLSLSWDSHPPLVDALDHLALIKGPYLYIIKRNGQVLGSRTFESDIREIRLGPEHLFVALDYAIYRFSN